MPFNSVQFAIFFVIVYGLYISLGHKWQNRMLLAASCVFYSAWDWRFLFLIFTSITTDYILALKIHGTSDDGVRKRFLLLSIFVNLSILGFFKYFNFFASSLQLLLKYFGLEIHPTLLNIALPVGISFYTFKTMSYTFDVYTGKIAPTRSYRDYALFVSFFPTLVAGPIERAGRLLTQIASSRKIDLRQLYDGAYLLAWGLCQKIFLADNLAKIVNPVFNAAPPYNGADVLVAVYAFAFQIYCDFAGYSNIARGLGKFMGFDIMINFNLPYLATNPQDFWNRWHISLSNWLRDYLYTPMAFSARALGNLSVVLALIITFILCGLWHGAAWTFVMWGAYHGLLLGTHRLSMPLLRRIPSPKGFVFGKLWIFIKILFFFNLICLGWLLFRSDSAGQAYSMFKSVYLDFNIMPDTLGSIKALLVYILISLGLDSVL